MSYFKEDEIVAIEDEFEIFHVNCYDGNVSELKVDNIVTENNLIDGDWYFCDSCGKLINKY
jgi:hypothetical protein